MNNPKKSITKEEIKQLPSIFTLDLCALTNEAEMDSALLDLKSSEVIGIDTETKPNFVKESSIGWLFFSWRL